MAEEPLLCQPRSRPGRAFSLMALGERWGAKGLPSTLGAQPRQTPDSAASLSVLMPPLNPTRRDTLGAQKREPSPGELPTSLHVGSRFLVLMRPGFRFSLLPPAMHSPHGPGGGSALRTVPSTGDMPHRAAAAAAAAAARPHLGPGGSSPSRCSSCSERPLSASLGTAVACCVRRTGGRCSYGSVQWLLGRNPLPGCKEKAPFLSQPQ